jgi:hypothetical protein
MFDQCGVHTRDKGQRPLRNRGIFLDKHWVSPRCETFHTQNVKRFTFFPQARLVSPWNASDAERSSKLNLPFIHLAGVGLVVVTAKMQQTVKDELFDLDVEAKAVL